MSNITLFFLIYFSGWIILSIGYFIYKVFIDEDTRVNKKVHAWYSIWVGFFSWLGIYFIIVFLIGGICFELNEWIVNKLKK